MSLGCLFIQNRDKVAQRHVAQAAIDLACEAYGINPIELLPSGRAAANISLTRQVAIYLAHVVGQLTVTQLAEEFDRDRSTVSHACHLIEDKRDSPIFDQQMNFLEKEFKRQIVDLYRNWLSESAYYNAGVSTAG